MKRLFLLIFIQAGFYLTAMETYHELSAGAYGDLGASLAFRVESPSPDIPFFIQGKGAYAYQNNPGNATEARKIFINDNTGGNIEKYGESYLAGVDLGWSLPLENRQASLEVTLSGLWNYYMAHFSFIGNNESFTVKSSGFGAGLGAAVRLPVSGGVNSLILKGGAEYFPKSQLDAHGTYFYTPDGDDDRPRNDYTYEDADSAVNQPEFRVYLLLGLLYRIGK